MIIQLNDKLLINDYLYFYIMSYDKLGFFPTKSKFVGCYNKRTNPIETLL